MKNGLFLIFISVTIYFLFLASVKTDINIDESMEALVNAILESRGY